MITFKPQRPDILIADLWHSVPGHNAYDAGYDWYCETFYKNLGQGWYTVEEARNHAERAGLHLTMISLQSHCEQVERNEAWKKEHGYEL